MANCSHKFVHANKWDNTPVSSASTVVIYCENCGLISDHSYQTDLMLKEIFKNMPKMLVGKKKKWTGNNSPQS